MKTLTPMKMAPSFGDKKINDEIYILCDWNKSL